MRGFANGIHTAPLMTVVSASGGAGKSTIALLCACLAARAGVKTTLLEGDLQFGDYGIWLGLDEELPDLSLGAECPPIALADCLDLLKAPCFPEAAEQASDEVVACLPSIRSTPDLVVADTGQFWNGLTAGLVCSSDLVLLIMDARRASVYGALKALELLARVGVASARVVPVFNRYSPRCKDVFKHAQAAFAAQELFTVPDGKRTVELELAAGKASEFLDANGPVVQSVNLLMEELMPRMGRLYVMPQAEKREGRVR